MNGCRVKRARGAGRGRRAWVAWGEMAEAPAGQQSPANRVGGGRGEEGGGEAGEMA